MNSDSICKHIVTLHLNISMYLKCLKSVNEALAPHLLIELEFTFVLFFFHFENHPHILCGSRGSKVCFAKFIFNFMVCWFPDICQVLLQSMEFSHQFILFWNTLSAYKLGCLAKGNLSIRINLNFSQLWFFLHNKSVFGILKTFSVFCFVLFFSSFEFFFQNISPFEVIMYGMLLESVQHFVQVCYVWKHNFRFYVLLKKKVKKLVKLIMMDHTSKTCSIGTTDEENFDDTHPRWYLFIVDSDKIGAIFILA